jgi:hypothetical protein
MGGNFQDLGKNDVSHFHRYYQSAIWAHVKCRLPTNDEWIGSSLRNPFPPQLFRHNWRLSVATSLNQAAAVNFLSPRLADAT